MARTTKFVPPAKSTNGKHGGFRYYFEEMLACEFIELKSVSKGEEE